MGIVSKHIIVATGICVVLGLTGYSQTVTNTAPTLGPVIRAYYDALKRNDDAAVARTLSSRYLSSIKRDMKTAKRKDLAAFLAETDYRDGSPPIEVKDEAFEGNQGSAQVRGSFYKSWVPIGFVKEKGTWRLSGEVPRIGPNRFPPD